MTRLEEAVQLAVQQPRTVARRITKAGCYEDADVYIFCQEMHKGIGQIDRMRAEEFKQALRPVIILAR